MLIVLLTWALAATTQVGSLDAPSILRALKGDPVGVGYAVKVPVPPAMAEFHISGDATAVVHGTWTFRKGKQERAFVMLVTAHEEHTCHACGPGVELVSLTRSGGSWNVDNRTDLGLLGQYGAADSAELVQIGPERYAVALSSGYMHMGYVGSGVTFYAESPTGFASAGGVNTSDSNEGVCGPDGDGSPCYDMTAGWSFRPGKDAQTWDLVVKESGTALVDGKVVPRKGEVVRAWGGEGWK